MSPPFNLRPFWFSTYLAFTIAKYGISMCVLGLHEELRPFNIAVNALWPATGITSAALVAVVGSEKAYNNARNPEIMADATYAILIQDPKPTGQFFIDEEVLRKAGISDFDQYLNNPIFKHALFPDFYLNVEYNVNDIK